MEFGGTSFRACEESPPSATPRSIQSGGRAGDAFRAPSGYPAGFAVGDGKSAGIRNSPVGCLYSGSVSSVFAM